MGPSADAFREVFDAFLDQVPEEDHTLGEDGSPEDEARRLRNAGPLTTHICHLWNLGERKKLANFCRYGDVVSGRFVRLEGYWLKVQKLLNDALHGLFTDIKKFIPCVHESIKATLGPSHFQDEVADVDDYDAPRGGRTKFFKGIQDKSKDNYINLLRVVLRSLAQWGDNAENVRGDTNVDFTQAQVRLLERFHVDIKSCVEEDSNVQGAKGHIIDLALGLLKCNADERSSYRSEPLCAALIGLCADRQTGELVHDMNCNKGISACKYLLRGAVLLRVVEGDSIDDWKQFIKAGNKRDTISTLNLLQKGISCFQRPPKYVVEHEKDAEGRPTGELKVQGTPLGRSVISKMVAKTHNQIKRYLEELLMGLDMVSARGCFPKAFPQDGDSGVLGRGCDAFDKEKSNGLFYGLGEAAGVKWNLLRDHVLGDETLRSKFLKKNKSLKGTKIVAYLQKCLGLESAALALFHVLTGCGNRASGEFASLRYRNCGPNGTLKRTVELYDRNVLLVTGTSWKNMLQGARCFDKFTMVDRHLFEVVLEYWAFVRPFACLLAMSLNASLTASQRLESKYRKLCLDDEEGWRVRCFVKSKDPKYITSAVSKSFGGKAGFQQLRHASEALFSEYIVPKQLAIERIAPFDNLFGHSSTVGIAYGCATEAVRYGSGRSAAAVDLTSLRTCMKLWWKMLPAFADLVCDSESVSDDDSDSFSSSCLWSAKTGFFCFGSLVPM